MTDLQWFVMGVGNLDQFEWLAAYLPVTNYLSMKFYIGINSMDTQKNSVEMYSIYNVQESYLLEIK